MRVRTAKSLDFGNFIARQDSKGILYFRRKQVIFSQGDRNDSLFYIEEGSVKLSVSSNLGKQAVIGILSGGDIFGETCVMSQQRGRSYTAVALTDVRLLKMKREEVVRAFTTDPAIAYSFITYVLRNSMRAQDNLADNLLHSTELRLARALWLLADLQKRNEFDPAFRISQQMLAEMIGTTRQRVNILMGRFRKRGLIRYDGALRVRPAILRVRRKR